MDLVAHAAQRCRDEIGVFRRAGRPIAVADDEVAGSVFRAAAIFGRSPELESRTLGRGGSSSLINRTISPSAACRSRCLSSGVVPVSSS